MAEIIVECCGLPESQCRCDQQIEIRTTRTIGQIKDILDGLAASNPDDYDTLKMACEIYQICLDK